jgi:F-type H+-transporting ATPase subunit b
MTLRTLLSVTALTALLALVASGVALAETPPAGVDPDAVAAHQAVHDKIPNMNWVGENPEGDGPPAVLMFVNFAVFVGLVVGLGRKPLLRYMESRHTLIKDALQEAAKIRADAQAKLEEYSQRIADVDTEVDQLIADVRADAQAEKERIIEEGRQQAERMKRDAESRIAAEFARARQEIEQEVVAAAVAAAEALLRKSATSRDKSALVDAFITDIQHGGSASDSPAPPRGAS